MPPEILRCSTRQDISGRKTPRQIYSNSQLSGCFKKREVKNTGFSRTTDPLPLHFIKVSGLADVTVTVQLQLMVSNRDENPDLDSRIRGALKDFVDTHWTLLEQERSSATPGFERIQLKAVAKVPAKENRKLEERAAHANREGLEFGRLYQPGDYPPNPHAALLDVKADHLKQARCALEFCGKDAANLPLASTNRRGFFSTV